MNPRWTLLIVLLIGIGAAVAWQQRRPAPAAKAAGGARGVPVIVAEVAVRDMPLWLSGLGTVQASNTVTVRPRVGGSLDKVFFTEGQNVQAGDVLAQIDPRPYRAALEQVRARQAQNEAQLANARRELERIRALVANDAESRRILERQESAVAQSTAQLKADQAAIEVAQLDLDFTTVRAPIAGRTGVRLVDAGNLVTASQGSGLVVITQVQPVSVLFTLPQHHLPALRRRLQADATPPVVHAVSDQGEVLARGHLELIDNQIDSATGTARLKATFPNSDLALWPGQFVTALILVETRPAAVVVPAEVIQSGLHGPFAYVVQADQTVEARAVRPGPTIDGFTLVEQGLKPGERVVRDGQSKLQPGARVAPEGRKGPGEKNGSRPSAE
ncbi:MAG: efflux RND transporter periplasmic adaptor subunit [Opitutaceae bacterium]|nr:efflux RND transporter periplasmic adaptor subunit [Opitutaceae bacterium]